jgi:predicted Rossmann-fold nucleotide-binding protein
VNGFYQQLSGFLDHLVSEGFVRTPHRDMLQRSESAGELLDQLAAWQPDAAPKWAASKPD